MEPDPEPVAFGTASSCSRQDRDMASWQDALGTVDLTNTPFALDDTFEIFGTCPVGGALASAKVAQLEVDGGVAPPMGQMMPPPGCGQIGPAARAAHFGQECMMSQVAAPDRSQPADELQLRYVGGAPRASQTAGWCSYGDNSFSSADQVVDLTGDGQCGGIVPIRLRGRDGCHGGPHRRTTQTDYVLRLAPQ